MHSISTKRSQKFFFEEKFSKARRTGEGKVQAQFPTSSRFQGAMKHSENFKEKLFTRGILELKYAPFLIFRDVEGAVPYASRLALGLVFKS